jgi:AraC family transcriptional regulator
MKKEKLEIIHQIVSTIYEELSTDLSLKYFAKKYAMSPYHLLRLFKHETGRTLYECVQNVRLQHAALLLLSEHKRSIADIAVQAGYAAHASFIRAFKKRFNQTPMQWKKSHVASNRSSFKLQTFVVTLPTKELIYLRSQDYDDLHHSWQRLKASIHQNNLPERRQLMIFDDNPYLTASKEAHYRIAMEVETHDENLSLPQCKSKEQLALRCDLEGSFEDLLGAIERIYRLWLPQSGYTLQAKPATLVFEKNPFYHGYKAFKAALYLPI